MCKSQVNGKQTHRSKGNGYERQPLSVFGVGSLNSPASLFLKNHIKIAPTRLSYKFRGGCLSRLPREAQVAKQSGNGESREERKTSSSRKRDRERRRNKEQQSSGAFSDTYNIIPEDLHGQKNPPRDAFARSCGAELFLRRIKKK